jgi:hypothetical protein
MYWFPAVSQFSQFPPSFRSFRSFTSSAVSAVSSFRSFRSFRGSLCSRGDHTEGLLFVSLIEERRSGMVFLSMMRNGLESGFSE